MFEIIIVNEIDSNTTVDIQRNNQIEIYQNRHSFSALKVLLCGRQSRDDRSTLSILSVSVFA
jgi:hypothetical protein